MVELKVGDLVDMTAAKSGESAKGPWLMVRVGDEDGKRKKGLTVFAGNPDEAATIQSKAKVTQILRVRKKAYKLPSGEWATEPSVEVEAILERPTDADFYATVGFGPASTNTPAPAPANMPFN